MFFDLDELGRVPREFDRLLELADLRGEEGQRLLPRGARLSGRFEPLPRGVGLVARLETSLRLGCCRCLEPFEQALAIDFGLTVVGPAADSGGREVHVRAEDADLFHADAGRVDLAAIAREQVHLHLPLKPICATECRGLCPSCGGNRNRIKCGCRSEEIDPRFAPLMRLKQRKP